METYDEAAFEKFCGELVNAGFSPVRDSGRQKWTGPLRPSLRPLTDATRMRVVFYPGWPLRYAHVVVHGLRSVHASDGLLCLWAEDDPAQMAGCDINGFWARLDEWAETAQRGFRIEDRALDAFMLYEEGSNYRAELPLGDFLRQGGNGYRTPVHAVTRAQKALFIAAGEKPEKETTKPVLKGMFYLRGDIGTPPRNLEDVRAALTRKQLIDLDHGLADRTPTGLLEASDGYDFIVLAWPRHDNEHDAVVIGFENQGESLKSYAIQATPNDTAARQRRAGPDAPALTDKTVLVAGAGSVGGHVAVGLASNGVGNLRIHDAEYLTTANLARHVCPDIYVGYSKTIGVAATVGDHAPWTSVDRFNDLSHEPSMLIEQVKGVDLVVDCTGIFSVSAALAHICQQQSIPLITGALFHQGAIARVQRQAENDTPIAVRNIHPNYNPLPPEGPAEPDHGFLELGCTAPVNNASPVAVTTTAADICHAAVDYLTGRLYRSDERVIVFRPMTAPFDRTGTHDLGITATSGDNP